MCQSWLSFQDFFLPGLGVCASPGCSSRTGCVCQSWRLSFQEWVCVPVLAVLPGLGLCASPGCSSRTGCVCQSWRLSFQEWVCVPVLAVLPGLGVCASPGCPSRTSSFQDWVCVPVLAVLPGLGVRASLGCSSRTGCVCQSCSSRTGCVCQSWLSSRTGCVCQSWLSFQDWVCVPVLAVLPGLGVCASPGFLGVCQSWLSSRADRVPVSVLPEREGLNPHNNDSISDSLGALREPWFIPSRRHLPWPTYNFFPALQCFVREAMASFVVVLGN